VPAQVVLEQADALAFLDARPVFKGHVLVVPRLHTADLGDLEPEAAGRLFALGRRIALAMEAGLDANGAFMGLNNKVSQSVAHVHLHVIPRRFKDGLRGFFWPRTRYTDDAEAADYAERLRAALT
jgi:histidine triad (HIT) family protein